MSNELNGQDLIDAFLQVIRLRHHDRCQTILRSLEHLSSQQPALKPWCGYFKGYMVFEFQRDWGEAERILTDLLRIELEPALRGLVLYALGRSLDAQGRWEEAIAAFEQNLTIVNELGQTIEQSRAWKHLAISYRKGFTRGDFGAAVLDRAIIYGRSALELLESISEPSPDIVWLMGTIWNTLGATYMNLKQWDEAIACYQQELAICRAQNDHYGLGLTYGNLGEVYQKCGHWPEARAAYQQALSLIREFDDHCEETDALANVAFLHQEMGEYEVALDYYSQAIQLIEALRAGVSTEAAQAGFFATVVDTYANMALLCLATNRPEQAFNLVEQARSRAFLDSLAARSPELAEQVQRREQAEARIMTLDEVQAALPEDIMLLEYFTTGLVEAVEGRAAGPPVQRHRFPPPRTLIFAVTHDTLQVHDANLSPNDLRPRHLEGVVERHFLQPHIRQMLYDRLISPVEALLQGKRRLYLVPHGPLHYIPFQALIAPDGDTLLRETGPQLIYGPSATLLFRYGRTQRSQAPTSCLAIGYNGDTAPQLYFAEDEARSIARLTGGQAITGPMPKKPTLYRQAADYRLLHLACHGEFDPESPLDSFLQLAPGERLTALDILEQLRLRCDLVTLSACESGLNRVRRGDELVGLTRAFMDAGTPALVSTLWRVYENPTRILMEKFYQQIQAGVEFAEALKQAQLHIKNLSYQEALSMLASSAEDQSIKTTFSNFPVSGHQPDSSRTVMTFDQAITYLQGVVTRGRPDVARTLPAEPGPNDKAFADPYYWAAFILIGAHGS